MSARPGIAHAKRKPSCSAKPPLSAAPTARPTAAMLEQAISAASTLLDMNQPIPGFLYSSAPATHAPELRPAERWPANELAGTPARRGSGLPATPAASLPSSSHPSFSSFSSARSATLAAPEPVGAPEPPPSSRQSSSSRAAISLPLPPRASSAATLPAASERRRKSALPLLSSLHAADEMPASNVTPAAASSRMAAEVTVSELGRLAQEASASSSPAPARPPSSVDQRLAEHGAPQPPSLSRPTSRTQLGPLGRSPGTLAPVGAGLPGASQHEARRAGATSGDAPGLAAPSAPQKGAGRTSAAAPASQLEDGRTRALLALLSDLGRAENERELLALVRSQAPQIVPCIAVRLLLLPPSAAAAAGSARASAAAAAEPHELCARLRSVGESVPQGAEPRAPSDIVASAVRSGTPAFGSTSAAAPLWASARGPNGAALLGVLELLVHAQEAQEAEEAEEEEERTRSPSSASNADQGSERSEGSVSREPSTPPMGAAPDADGGRSAAGAALTWLPADATRVGWLARSIQARLEGIARARAVVERAQDEAARHASASAGLVRDLAVALADSRGGEAACAAAARAAAGLAGVQGVTLLRRARGKLPTAAHGRGAEEMMVATIARADRAGAEPPPSETPAAAVPQHALAPPALQRVLGALDGGSAGRVVPFRDADGVRGWAAVSAHDIAAGEQLIVALDVEGAPAPPPTAAGALGTALWDKARAAPPQLSAAVLLGASAALALRADAVLAAQKRTVDRWARLTGALIRTFSLARAARSMRAVSMADQRANELHMRNELLLTSTALLEEAPNGRGSVTMRAHAYAQRLAAAAEALLHVRAASIYFVDGDTLRLRLAARSSPGDALQTASGFELRREQRRTEQSDSSTAVLAANAIGSGATVVVQPLLKARDTAMQHSEPHARSTPALNGADEDVRREAMLRFDRARGGIAVLIKSRAGELFGVLQLTDRLAHEQHAHHKRRMSADEGRGLLLFSTADVAAAEAIATHAGLALEMIGHSSFPRARLSKAHSQHDLKQLLQYDAELQAQGQPADGYDGNEQRAEAERYSVDDERDPAANDDGLAPEDTILADSGGDRRSVSRSPSRLGRRSVVGLQRSSSVAFR